MNRYGFTLVELMIVIVISSILSMGLYSVYVSQSRSYNAQDNVTIMQQNVRSGLDMLVRDLRVAGLDETAESGAGFVDSVQFSNGSSMTETVTTGSATLAFTADLDSDGVIDLSAQDTDANGTTDMTDMEQVAYRLNGTDLERYSTTTGAIEWHDVAQGIEAIEFNYKLDDGTTTTAPSSGQLSNIRAIQISILARADREDPDFTNAMTYTPASGSAWDLNGADTGTGNPPNDHFRRRLMISTVQCRNMGI